MLVASTAISETEMTVFSPSVHSLGFEPEIGQTLWNRARSEDLLYVTPPTLSLNRSNLFLVHFSIAVVVHAVAELNSLWMDKVIIIVAVAILRGVGRKFFTTLDGFRSETIPVIILVIFSGHPLVDGSVAVVVFTITFLHGPRVDITVSIVAVGSGSNPRRLRKPLGARTRLDRDRFFCEEPVLVAVLATGKQLPTFVANRRCCFGLLIG